MEKDTIYLFGLGLKKHIQVLNKNTIKYNEVMCIDDQYTIIVFTFNQFIESNSDKEAKVIKTLEEQKLSLYDLNVEDFYQYESLFVNQEDKNVFFHCLHEHYRMNQMNQIIQKKQYDKLGRFMNDSYNSYKYYFQTTTQKQDYLFLLAEKHHAKGANISDNHLVCLIESYKKQIFIEKMKESFKNTYGKPLITEVNDD